jgi:ADP-heptose:LPS heptosyltransferase
LSQQGIDLAQPWLVIHPGATAASRRYPPEGFAAVAQALTQMGLQILFTGTQPELELVRSIQQMMSVPSYSLVDRLSLAELAALLSFSPLLLANNTGPVHIASALGTPIVDLYALTNLQHTPWNAPHRVLFHDVPCRLCYKSICPEQHHHCLRLVTPETVIQAVLDLFAETQSSVTTQSAGSALAEFSFTQLSSQLL